MFRKLVTIMLVFCILFATVAFSAEGEITDKDKEKEMLIKIFNTEYSSIENLLSKESSGQETVEQVVNTIKLIKNKLGNLKVVTKNEDYYKLEFDKGYTTSKIVLNNENKITSIWFNGLTLSDDSLETILSEFDELTCDVSICIKKNNDEVLVGVNQDSRMAVGSAFKLYVLKALKESVKNKTASWDDIIELNNDDKSIPTGILQEWPEKTPVTVKTLSNLMISISDNTAADHLIQYIGRGKIEEYMDKEAQPLLKTNEAFRLKYSTDKENLEKYINATLYDKREILKKLKDEVSLDDLRMRNIPIAIKEIEWFFTTEELCDVIYDLKDCGETRISPGFVAKDKWVDFGFKGGSEPGVLNFTQLLQKEEGGDVYTISVTLNDKENNIATNKAIDLVSRLISLLENNKLIRVDNK